jgi:hypothetical protein
MVILVKRTSKEQQPHEKQVAEALAQPNLRARWGSRKAPAQLPTASGLCNPQCSPFI